MSAVTADVCAGSERDSTARREARKIRIEPIDNRRSPQLSCVPARATNTRSYRRTRRDARGASSWRGCVRIQFRAAGITRRCGRKRGQRVKLPRDQQTARALSFFARSARTRIRCVIESQLRPPFASFEDTNAAAGEKRRQVGALRTSPIIPSDRNSLKEPIARRFRFALGGSRLSGGVSPSATARATKNRTARPPYGAPANHQRPVWQRCRRHLTRTPAEPFSARAPFDFRQRVRIT